MSKTVNRFAAEVRTMAILKVSGQWFIFLPSGNPDFNVTETTVGSICYRSSPDKCRYNLKHDR